MAKLYWRIKKQNGKWTWRAAEVIYRNSSKILVEMLEEDE